MSPIAGTSIRGQARIRLTFIKMALENSSLASCVSAQKSYGGHSISVVRDQLVSEACNVEGGPTPSRD